MAEQDINRQDLKTNALLERIAQLENEKADYRVELTLYAQHNEALQSRVKELEDAISKPKEVSSTDDTD